MANVSEPIRSIEINVCFQFLVIFLFSGVDAFLVKKSIRKCRILGKELNQLTYITLYNL